MFGVLIAIHEFGHFATAKACRMRVDEFSIGMGPAIFKKQKGETQYSLRILPIGGYCAMGEDEESDDPRAFPNQNFWKRLAILCAGSFMNFLLGIVLIVIMYGGADKGYMYVAFHLKVKNTTDEKQWLSNDLNCVYDGDIGCDRAWGFNEGKSFSTSVTLSAGIGSDGYVCYIVPEKAKSVVLSYGDYVRVNIDLRDLSYRTESSQTSTDNT